MQDQFKYNQYLFQMIVSLANTEATTRGKAQHVLSI